MNAVDDDELRIRCGLELENTFDGEEFRALMYGPTIDAREDKYREKLAGDKERTGTGLQFVAEYLHQLRKLVENEIAIKRNRPEWVDDAWDVCIINYCETPFNAYDAGYGTGLRPFMFKRFKWQLASWFYKQDRKRKLESLPKQLATVDENSALMTLDSLMVYKAHFADDEWLLLKLHIQGGQTFAEIAEKIGGATTTLRIKFNGILSRAQRIAKDRGDFQS